MSFNKMFSKRGYTLTPAVRETKDEEKEFTNAKRGFRKNSLPIPIKASGNKANKTEFFFGSSSGGDSNYTVNVRKGEVFFSDQSLQSSNGTDEGEGIFDMELDTGQSTSANTASNQAKQTSGYTLSEEYFLPIYRKKQFHDIQESQHGMSHNPRRKSSSDEYYDKHKSDKKNHYSEALPTQSMRMAVRW